MARSASRGRFAERVYELVSGNPMLEQVAEAILVARKALRAELAALDRRARNQARDDATCRLLMTAPGVGALTALTFKSAVKAMVPEGRNVTCEDGTRQSLRNLLRTCRGKRTFTAHFGAAGDTDPMWLNFAARRIKGKELLIVATNRPAHHALTTCSQRRAIECLFAEARTKGFNLEDTRLSIAKKSSLLIGIVALTMAWAAKMASKKLGTRKRPGKSHGRYAKSIFRIGLDEIGRLLRTQPEQAFQHWPKVRHESA